jgi:hypothetical protein
VPPVWFINRHEPSFAQSLAAAFNMYPSYSWALRRGTFPQSLAKVFNKKHFLVDNSAIALGRIPIEGP